MQDQAGTVIGGTIDVSRPETPRSMRPESTGRRSRQRSSTSEGSAQSRPITITFFAAWVVIVSASVTSGMVVARGPGAGGMDGPDPCGAIGTRSAQVCP